jgi:hypothetical protein
MFKKLAALAAGTIAVAGVFAPTGAAVADSEGLVGPRATTTTKVAPPTADGPAATVRGFGWAADDSMSQPVGVPYASPRLDHSSGTLSDNAATLVRQGTGTYRVTLRGINGDGVPHVTNGINPSRCRVQGWKPNGQDQDVTIACHNRLGQLANSAYLVSFSNLKTTKYPNARLYYSGSTVPAANRYNSAGGINTVSRGTTGVYRVVLPRLGSQAGQVQVTATGAGVTWCKISSWGSATKDQVITVRCFAPNGTPANSAFLLSYAQAGNILGAPNVQAGLGLRSAYASVNPTGTPAVDPARRYSTPSGGTWNATAQPDKSVIVKTAITISDPVDAGSVQVTALGGSAISCHVANFFDDQVTVRCMNSAGGTVLNPFAVSIFSKQLR